MPIEKLPGANLNTAPLHNINWYVRPPRPIFPTAQVVEGALNNILPALDPVERAKRADTMQQLALHRQQMPLEQAKIQYGMRQLGMQNQLLDQLQNKPFDMNSPDPQIYSDSKGNIIDERRNPDAYKKRIELLKNKNPYSTNPSDYSSTGSDFDAGQAFNSDLSDAEIPAQAA